MPAEVREPQRLRVGDEDPEDAVAAGHRADRRALVVVQADGQELGELRMLFVQHPERPVAGVDQVGRGFDDALQHRGQIQLGADREHRVEQPTQLAGAGEAFHAHSVGSPALRTAMGDRTSAHPDNMSRSGGADTAGRSGRGALPRRPQVAEEVAELGGQPLRTEPQLER